MVKREQIGKQEKLWLALTILRARYKECVDILVGSRATCNPPNIYGDWDVIVYLPGDPDWAFCKLEELGWGHDGSNITPNPYRKMDRGNFVSYSIDDGEYGSNIIITNDKEFFNRFLVASMVAKTFNLMDKKDRVTLFQAVLDNNFDR